MSICPEVEALSDEEAMEIGMELLHLQREDVKLVHLTRWSQVPWSGGSYSTFSRGCHWDDIDAFSCEMGERRVVFAGEHTHEEHQGAVHAAFLSGVDAAGRVGISGGG